MRYRQQLEAIQQRLLADVDDSMEHIGTIFNPEESAKVNVTISINDSIESILQLTEELIYTGYTDIVELEDAKAIDNFEHDRRVRNALRSKLKAKLYS
jgi:hypothetical protein